MNFVLYTVKCGSVKLDWIDRKTDYLSLPKGSDQNENKHKYTRIKEGSRDVFGDHMSWIWCSRCNVSMLSVQVCKGRGLEWGNAPTDIAHASTGHNSGIVISYNSKFGTVGKR